VEQYQFNNGVWNWQNDDQTGQQGTDRSSDANASVRGSALHHFSHNQKQYVVHHEIYQK